MEKIFYVVWNDKTGQLYHKHESEQSARDEAKRLARKQPMDTFYVLKAVSRARVPVEMQELLYGDPDDPFTIE